MGVTFASFHIKGAMPEVREMLNRSLRGIQLFEVNTDLEILGRSK